MGLMANDKALRQHLVNLLKGGDAHADFEHAISDFPPEARGKKALKFLELNFLSKLEWIVLCVNCMLPLRDRIQLLI